MILSFFQMPEEETFCVFVQLMNKYKLRELYKPSMAQLSTCFYQLESLVEVYIYTSFLPNIKSNLISKYLCRSCFQNFIFTSKL